VPAAGGSAAPGRQNRIISQLEFCKTAMAGAKGLKLLVLAQAVAWAAAFKQLGNLKMPNLGNVAKDMEAKAKFGAPAAPNVRAFAAP